MCYYISWSLIQCDTVTYATEISAKVCIHIYMTYDIFVTLSRIVCQQIVSDISVTLLHVEISTYVFFLFVSETLNICISACCFLDFLWIKTLYGTKPIQSCHWS